MFDIFGWLRRKAMNAVLGGIQDAVEQIAPGDGPPDLEKLRALVASEVKALPAANPAKDESAGDAEATAKKRGK